MEINVEYKNQLGHVSNLSIRMRYLALIKHLAIAGQAYSPSPSKLMRALGMLLHYKDYISYSAFNNDKFSQPHISLSDPTEKAQFSALAGKAIADFLSKQINRSLFTINYEAAMRIQGLPIKGSRPDLLAFTNTHTIALEAKGRTQPTAGNMSEHKTQAQSGPIPVNFSIACISYNLYNEVKCKYHDPENPETPYDENLLIKLSKDYYNSLNDFIKNKDIFPRELIDIKNEKFYIINLTRMIINTTPYLYIFPTHYIPIYLILPHKIEQFANEGLVKSTEPFFYNSISNYMYVDTDRVGIFIDERNRILL